MIISIESLLKKFKDILPGPSIQAHFPYSSMNISEKIMYLLRDKGALTYWQIGAYIGGSTDSIKEYISELVEENKIKGSIAEELKGSNMPDEAKLIYSVVNQPKNIYRLNSRSRNGGGK